MAKLSAPLAPAQLPADVAALVVAMGATSARGFNVKPNTYELYNGRYARFQAESSVSGTIQAALRAMYEAGLADGESCGVKSTQERLRNLLGLSERSTDGHSRTVVIED